MTGTEIIDVAVRLEEAGLVWRPEIGDEVAVRSDPHKVSVLVDPQGLTPKELRQSFLWLPTVEQLVSELEAREGLIFHAGVNQARMYEVAVRMSFGLVEAQGINIRTAFGNVLTEVLGQSANSFVQ